jgi:hypothetical protein
LDCNIFHTTAIPRRISFVKFTDLDISSNIF